jgi:hypothetical protein
LSHYDEKPNRTQDEWLKFLLQSCINYTGMDNNQRVDDIIKSMLLSSGVTGVTNNFKSKPLNNIQQKNRINVVLFKKY